MTRARARSARSGQTEHVYDETRYAARSWKQQRRVVIKAEVARLADREPRDNPRFVVTNLSRPPRSVYEKVYCARGDIENRIKELLDGLQIDRTSCCRFLANQFRVLLTAAAYVLLQELRLCAAGTACARTQVTWLRDRLLKLGVHVVRSVRRVVLPSAARNPLPRRVAPHRTRPRSARRIGPTRATRTSSRRHRSPHRRSCRCSPFHHPPSPPPDGVASLACSRTNPRASVRSPIPSTTSPFRPLPSPSSSNLRSSGIIQASLSGTPAAGCAVNAGGGAGGASSRQAVGGDARAEAERRGAVDGATAFLAAVPDHRLERLVTVALGLGLRQGEALRLRWADVDLEAGELSVRRTLERAGSEARFGRAEAVGGSRCPASRSRRCDGTGRASSRSRLVVGPRWCRSGLVFTSLRRSVTRGSA